MDFIEMPIDGVLDLHTFNPKELPDLLSDYLSACREKGIMTVRIVHGKGTGVQKARVRSLLAKNPTVVNFKDAPEPWGGWGATVVTLR
ncbi:MAG: Smr/MutS family protein [Desulfatitalea sp.]|nr:Smr/MutS family protein [Desulfatitalea sp.]MBI5895400.1 Smr/MutS family protein [Desulfobacterales bacterium]